jgi:sulfate transport system permease protein
MALIAPQFSTETTGRVPGAVAESAWVRWSLTGIAVAFLTIFIVLPVVNVFAQAFSQGVGAYTAAFHAPPPKGDEASLTRAEKRALTKQRTQADKTWNAIKMTLGIAAIAVPLNCVFGVAAAWLIAKFRFKGRALLLSLIDLPFSVSPVVAGLIFVLMFGRTGWFGHWALDWKWSMPAPAWTGFANGVWPFGLNWTEYQGVIFTPMAMVLATIFITFPFVARNLIPLMESQGNDDELAAMTLGASGWQTFRRVTLPNIKWGLLYGVILCNARAMGEFGAVSVVAGHLDYNNTIPLRVEQLWLEPGNNQAAFAVASILTVLAVVTLILKTLLEYKTRKEVVNI